MFVYVLVSGQNHSATALTALDCEIEAPERFCTSSRDDSIGLGSESLGEIGLSLVQWALRSRVLAVIF